MRSPLPSVDFLPSLGVDQRMNWQPAQLTIKELMPDLQRLISDLQRTIDEQLGRNGALEQVLGARDEEIRRLKAEAKDREDQILKLTGAVKARGESASDAIKRQLDQTKFENIHLKELLRVQAMLIKSQERVITLEGDDYR